MNKKSGNENSNPNKHVAINDHRGKVSGGYTGGKPADPRPSTPPPTQRSKPSEQKGNDKKENP